MRKKMFASTASSMILFSTILIHCGFSQKTDWDMQQSSSEETITYLQVNSPSLENNWTKDTPVRSVIIYLPPEYDTVSKHYPVVYLLHGYTGRSKFWDGDPVDIKHIMNYLIKEKIIEPFIVVMPDSHNRYRGSWYTNSYVTGNWEDFIVQDLVQFIDSTYRSLPYSESRGIAGSSMGGYGAMKIAMKHPGIFSAVYPNCGAIDLEGFFMDAIKDVLVETVNGGWSGWQNDCVTAAAVVFAPDTTLDPPGKYPVTKRGSKILTVWQEWLKHDPYTMIPAYKDSLLKLNAIQFDVGESDPYMYEGNIRFSQALTNYGIEHVFETYPGDHGSGISWRTQERIMPFFSENLAHDTLWTSILYRRTSQGNSSLYQNNPNPFSITTTIEFQLPQSKITRIDIFSTLGSRIITLLNSPMPAGRNQLEFDASGLPEGIYFYRISTDNFQDTKRMILMR